MNSSQGVSTHASSWQAAGRHLWLGIAGEQDVAILEKDGRYTAIDAAGRVRGLYPSLLQAQIALAPAAVGAVRRRRLVCELVRG